jgi:RimJ/RimL family protein N-acetyltransferase
VLRTARLLLREPRDEDVDAFLAIASDPESIRYFHKPLDRAECAKQIADTRPHFAAHGFGRWAVELPGEASFIGLVGLTHVTFDAPFVPAVEIGWRIARPFWRRGFAREAAEAAIADGFRHGLTEIVAFTVPDNAPSRAVMQSLGMTHDAGAGFDHPRLPEGHKLRRHVLYRLRRS